MFLVKYISLKQVIEIYIILTFLCFSLQVSGSYTAEYVEFEVKRAFEWLSAEKTEIRRHAAVSILNKLTQ